MPHSRIESLETLETKDASSSGRSDGPDPSIDAWRARRTGLAPRDARSWLRLHRRFALFPERISEALQAGMEPDEILAATAMPADGRQTRTTEGAEARSLDRDLRRLEELGTRVVPRPDLAYPDRLGTLVDAPCVLLVRGRVESLALPGVAIVGARAATEAARHTARRLARELAAGGLTIISGLARGIDAAAHRGALDVGGRTIAVLACGPDRIYPPEHRGLAEEICEHGAVVSEMPLGSPPRRSHFPLRNRLISGLSLGVIVVEARRRSGSLITVRHALDQGREVFVVPGAVEGPFAEGTNALLRDGARPILDAGDVFEDLGLEPSGIEAETALDSSSSTDPVPASETRGADPSLALETSPGNYEVDSSPHDPAVALILALLDDGPLDRDVLCRRLALPSGRFARALLELELAERVIQDRDGRLQRKWR